MYNYNLKCEGIYEVGDLLGKPVIYGRVDLVTIQAVSVSKAFTALVTRISFQVHVNPFNMISQHFIFRKSFVAYIAFQ